MDNEFSDKGFMEALQRAGVLKALSQHIAFLTTEACLIFAIRFASGALLLIPSFFPTVRSS